MMEPRNLTLLYNAVEKDYAWRISELSSIKSTVIISRGNVQSGLLRGAITLLYAHWEGFVKKLAELYYEFVSYQDLKIEELNDAFVSMVLRSELEMLSQSKKIVQHSNVVRILIEEKKKKAYFSSNSPIRTANLKFEVFEDVCMLIGIEPSYFLERYRKSFTRSIELTINEDLVKRRNTIAHGEYLAITVEEFKELYDVIVNGFLYHFKEIIMDAAQAKKYLRHPDYPI